MALNPASNYCTMDDIADLMSQNGMQLCLDDNPPSLNANVLDKAGNLVDRYLCRRYDPSQLALSPVIRDCCAAIGAYYLGGGRRGNPAAQGFATMYEDVIAYFVELKKGLNEIPGIAARKSYAPIISVMRSTLRPFPRTVVERSRSSQAAGGPENFVGAPDPWDTFGFNASGWLNCSF